MASKIQFGTSGWRAIIADQFTLENVHHVVDSVARYVLENNPGQPTLLVGYDTRFLSETFAVAAAERAASHGIQCFLANGSVPTPALSYEIRRRKAAGGINFTASHKLAEYNGIKFSTANGAPALPEVTRQIEAGIQDPVTTSAGRKPARVEPADFQSHYLTGLAEIVDLDLIRRTHLGLVYDPLYGAGRGYLDALLERSGIKFTTIHGWRDVLFGGHPPEPSDEHMDPLRKAMRATGAPLGLATDGDADRFGICDQGGAFLSPNHILALLLDYLVESRPWSSEPGWTGGVARSVATTHLIDAVAKHYGMPVYETPVGFKYIGELVEQDKIYLGGEESAGMTIRHHVPEKDGILACLLTAEMVASRRSSLKEQLAALFKKVGPHYPGRWNVALTDEVRQRFVERSSQEYSSFQGRAVSRSDRTDGLKLICEDGSWVLFRLSGTEPVYRIYCEAGSPPALKDLAQAARDFLFG